MIRERPLPTVLLVALAGVVTGLIAVAAVLGFAGPAAAQDGCSTPGGADGCWELDFVDEFDGDALNLAAWEPGWYVDSGYSRSVNDNEDACYNTDQVTVAGGALRIRLDATNDPLCLDKEYDIAPHVGGLINSRYALRDVDHPVQLNGTYFVEARIKSPSDGQTLWNWPAFWTNGGSPWPTNGEIDILEGLRGKAKFNYHYLCGDTNCQVGATEHSEVTLDGGWHVYAAERRVAADADGGAATITYYLDGVAVGQVTENVTESQHFIILDYTSHESHNTTRTGVAMEVDWVRTWSPSDTPPLPPFACEADAGVLSWTDHNVVAERYWVYRSVDGGETFAWLGRAVGETTFVDPAPTVGARYQVHYEGTPRRLCEIVAEPTDSIAPFRCQIDRADGRTVLSWTDHNDVAERYWVYRSVDGGETFAWLGRAVGETTFVDPAPVADAQYQVHYAGTPRSLCEQSDYSCLATAQGSDAVLYFAGRRGSSENLRDATEWIAGVTDLTSYRVTDGAGGAYVVRLRGNDWTGPNGFAAIDCIVVP